MSSKQCWILIILLLITQIIAPESEQDLFMVEEDIKRGLSQFMPYGRITPEANGSASTISGVPGGGTGRTTFVPDALVAGGVTSQSPLQQVSGLGTTGQVLTSAGPNALPVWSTVSTGLPGYIAGTRFLLGGRSNAVNAVPDNTTILSGNQSGYLNLQNQAVQNTLVGSLVGSNLTTGDANSAFGDYALNLSTQGSNNSAFGVYSLGACDQAFRNAAFGGVSLSQLSTGNNNIAIGYYSGKDLMQGDNNIYIGSNVAAINSTESNIIVIGNSDHTANTYIKGISGATPGLAGVAVLVDANGQLGTTPSSRRFKENIENVDIATADKILDLDVVQFNYKNDAKKEIQYGVIAEDVEPIFPEMIVYDLDGQVDTVQYHKMLPLLIKQVQLMKAEYQSQINTLQSRITTLETQINNL